MDNAIKFSHENGVINLSFALEDKFVIVTVEDHGIGISDEHLRRVKDRFFQVNPLNGGTGLGLAITQLIELHGGTMEMESELGHGTSVIVAPREGKIPMAGGLENGEEDVAGPNV